MNRPIKKRMKCVHTYRRSSHREEMKSTFTPEYRIYLMNLDVTKVERVLCRICCCNIVRLYPVSSLSTIVLPTREIVIINIIFSINTAGFRYDTGGTV